MDFDQKEPNGGKKLISGRNLDSQVVDRNLGDKILSDKIKSRLNRKELNSLDIRRQSIMLKFNALNHEQKKLASKSEKLRPPPPPPVDKTLDSTEKSRQKLLDDKISRLKTELKNCESEIEERKHGTPDKDENVKSGVVKPPDINSFLIEQKDYLSTIHSKTIQARQRSANSRLESARFESTTTTDTSSSSEQMKRRAKSRDYDTSLKRQIPLSSSKSHNSKNPDFGKSDSKSPDSKNPDSKNPDSKTPDSNSKKKHSNGRIFFGKTGIFQNNSVPPDTSKSILKNSRNEHQQPPLSSVKNPPDKVEKFSEKSAGGNVRRKGSFDEIEEFEKFSKTILAKFQPK